MRACVRACVYAYRQLFETRRQVEIRLALCSRVLHTRTHMHGEMLTDRNENVARQLGRQHADLAKVWTQLTRHAWLDDQQTVCIDRPS